MADGGGVDALAKMRFAVRLLATGQLGARNRVHDVYGKVLVGLTASDFPEALQAEFEAIMKELDDRLSAERGFRRTNKTAARIATRIYDLARELEHHRG